MRRAKKNIEKEEEEWWEEGEEGKKRIQWATTNKNTFRTGDTHVDEKVYIFTFLQR